MSIFWQEPLNNNTYILYGLRYYSGLYNRWSEFFSDIKSFSKLSKLLVMRQRTTINVSDRQILNQYISLGNVFTENSLARLSFFLANPVCHSEVKSILYFMNRLPAYIPEVKLDSIKYDTKLLESFQKI